MSETIKIEMTMPKPPEGFRYKGADLGEAECRLPEQGEWYLNSNLRAVKATKNFLFQHYIILERVPWEPKVGETVWSWGPFFGAIRKRFDAASPKFVFQTESDAVKFGQEVRALADRIRAESEVE